ncbi:MAG: glycosyltransferase family 4 protein [Candidatus Cloacimonetes bacterium]|nr:glycosyltransferase family 4 protein [Candidatus Cloacimonadota bacterium]
MKIAINCCYYGKTSGGIKEYIYNLVINLLREDKKNSYLFYVSIDDLDYWIETMPAEATYKIFPFKRRQKIKRALLQPNFWKKEYEIEKFAIFHSPFFHVPYIEGCKKIITVHDLRFRRYPGSYTFFRRIYVRHAFQRSLKMVDKIITVSEFTKKEILSFYSFDPNHIIPIHEAVDQTRFKISFDDELLLEKTGLKNNYLLTVGHLEPRKNYPLLIKAIEELNRDSAHQMTLVIVGKKNYKYQPTLRAIDKAKNVKYLDFVDHETLLSLYKNALLFIFPSIYEGFGFPPLEAAQFGVPSVVSNVSSIPEICGDGALYFDPFSKEDLIRAIKEAIEKRTELQKKAIANLERFSWKLTAKKTSELYKELTS